MTVVAGASAVVAVLADGGPEGRSVAEALSGQDLAAPEPLATRVWGLRGSLTAYDASYVALAAHLDAPLITLDQRLARAAAEMCRVVVPGG